MGREEEVNIVRQFIHFGPSLMSFRMVLQKRKKEKRKRKSISVKEFFYTGKYFYFYVTSHQVCCTWEMKEGK